jgi:hypothetical protein
MYERENVDAEYLRQIHHDAFLWNESQRKLKERRESNGICPYCGGPTSALCASVERPVQAVLPGVIHVGIGI